MKIYGELVVERRDDGSIHVLRADRTISITAELLESFSPAGAELFFTVLKYRVVGPDPERPGTFIAEQVAE